MFFSSITHVWAYFKNPWIWIFLFGFILAYFLFLVIIRFATQGQEKFDGASPGCMTQFLGVFLQAFFIATFNLLLLPVLLGMSQDISLANVEPMGFVAMRSGILAMIIITVVSFFPGIGPFLASSPGLESFWIAALSFRLMSPLYIEAILGRAVPSKEIYPHWGYLLGYFFIALILTRLLYFIFNRLAQNSSQQRSKYLNYLGPSVDILGGILPFFMYAWVVAQNISKVKGV